MNVCCCSLAPRGFCPVHKNQHFQLKFEFDQESDGRRTTLWMCYLQIIIYLFIYLMNEKRVDRVLTKCYQNLTYVFSKEKHSDVYNSNQ